MPFHIHGLKKPNTLHHPLLIIFGYSSHGSHGKSLELLIFSKGRIIQYPDISANRSFTCIKYHVNSSSLKNIRHSCHDDFSLEEQNAGIKMILSFSIAGRSPLTLGGWIPGDRKSFKRTLQPSPPTVPYLATTLGVLSHFAAQLQCRFSSRGSAGPVGLCSLTWSIEFFGKARVNSLDHLLTSLFKKVVVVKALQPARLFETSIVNMPILLKTLLGLPIALRSQIGPCGGPQGSALSGSACYLSCYLSLSVLASSHADSFSVPQWAVSVWHSVLTHTGTIFATSFPLFP